MSRAADDADRRPLLLWWLRPTALTVLFGVVPLLGAWLLDDTTYRDLSGAPKYVDGTVVLVAGAVLAGFVLALAVPRRPVLRRNLDADVVDVLRRATLPLFSLCTLGHALWLLIALQRADGNLPAFATVPGATTLVQFGVAYVPAELFVLLRDRTAGERHRAAVVRFSIVALLTVARALLVSERLALIEVALPAAVVASRQLGSTASAFWRRWLNLVPAAGLAGMVVVVAAADSLRGWNVSAALHPGSPLRFAFERLVAYYAVAVNNAAAHLTYGQIDAPLVHTLYSIVEAPLAGPVARWVLAVSPNALLTSKMRFLATFANPEYGTIAPFALWIDDVGVLIAPLLAFALGIVTLRLYSDFAAGGVSGLVLYPTWVLGLLELSRSSYWASPRYVPVLLAGLAVSLLAQRRRAGWAASSGYLRTARAPVDRSGASAR